MSQLSIVLLGAGGHAEVVLALLRERGHQIFGVSTPEFQSGSYWNEIQVIGQDEDILALDPDQVLIANGIGAVARKNARGEAYSRLSEKGYKFISLFHPSSIIAASVGFSAGVQVMAGAIIQPNCKVGADVIVNTAATVDHDCRIGDRSFIGPGVTLCGGVCIEDNVFVGAGAVILPGVNIGQGAIVGAGAVVTRSVERSVMVFGNPARYISSV